MSVFTTVTHHQLAPWLKEYPMLGDILELKGIASGVTNTNYFVTTTQGRYVLTLFEHNSINELSCFLDLMAYLSQHGIPCPQPVANHSGIYLGELNNKPAALVSCLRGTAPEKPTLKHCAEVGGILAQMHLAGKNFPITIKNPRDVDWLKKTSAALLPRLDTAQRSLLEAELAYQSRLDTKNLPRGVIHADLFRDNVLFESDQLTGVIDFYFACDDILAYDLAIAVNDWCIHPDGTLDQRRLQAMLTAYQATRKFSQQEHSAWPDLLRAGALRFWLSRLYDFHFPKPGEITHAKDPNHFRYILESRIQDRQQKESIS